MKKAISLGLLAVFVSLLAGPAAGQKGFQELKKQPLIRKESPAKSQFVKNAPAATEFGRVGAYSDGSSAYIAWEMVAEVGNIGFNVYRISKSGTELLNPE